MVAHGLLNTLSVVSGAAFTLEHHRDRLNDADRNDLLESFVDSGSLLIDGLDMILIHSSDEFADAATAVALAVRMVSETDRDSTEHSVLESVAERCKVLHVGLGALVRGLPAEVVQLLDSLAPTHH